MLLHKDLITFFQDFLLHFTLKASKSSMTQGRDTRFWQLAKKDMPSLAKTSASYKINNIKSSALFIKRPFRWHIFQMDFENVGLEVAFIDSKSIKA